MNSIRRTLALAITMTLALSYLGATLWSYVATNHELEEVFDAELAQMSRILIAMALAQDNDTDHDTTLKGDIMPQIHGHDYEKKLAFQVWDREGQVRFSGPMPMRMKPPQQIGFANVQIEDHTWRTFSLIDQDSGYRVITGQSGDIREELASKLAKSNSLPLFVSLPLLLVFVHGLLLWGFTPLTKLQNSIRDMPTEKLHPLDESAAPLEVKSLVRAINDLLVRLNLAMQHERQFTANAAHELKTPLAALRLTLEYELAQQPDKMTPLLIAVDRMGHLVAQMLALSRLDPEQGLPLKPCNLTALATDVLAEMAPLALARAIEPELLAPDAPLIVQGNPDLLMTLIRNLLSNAIQYSPPHTQITLSLTCQEDQIILQLCDQGPGIPAAQRAHAMKRFVRLDQRQATGAGLGLAIVTRIAMLHGAVVKLEDRPDGQSGLCVRLTFHALVDQAISPGPVSD